MVRVPSPCLILLSTRFEAALEAGSPLWRWLLLATLCSLLILPLLKVRIALLLLHLPAMLHALDTLAPPLLALRFSFVVYFQHLLEQAGIRESSHKHAFLSIQPRILVSNIGAALRRRNPRYARPCDEQLRELA